jgi:amino acid transporter
MDEDASVESTKSSGLHRHFGLTQAVALNVTMVVGAGVFGSIPYMLLKLPGPYAILGWIGAGLLILVDGLIWSELGAAMPGSGGTYLYLLESYGPKRWGRGMAFLFIWQFLISGPLEIASGLILMGTFSNYLSEDWKTFNEDHTSTWQIWEAQELSVSIGPTRIAGLAIGALVIFLLYRRVTTLGRLTVTFWLGVLVVLVWIIIDGAAHFNSALAFDYTQEAATRPDDFIRNLGGAMILAMYSYLGYYRVCYIGDEVRAPGKTIPRSILISSLLVVALFVATHLAMLGVVSWHSIPKDEKELGNYSLAAVFMQTIHGERAAQIVTVLLIWSCFGSVFAGMLGYSRIPYGAARYGHFFQTFGRVHPVHHIPHVSLLLIGALVLFWTFFDLANVINGLITTRILEQFIGQIGAVVLLRRTRPDIARPFKMWLYPLPCGLALVGWLYLYWSAGAFFIILGLVTLAAGVVAFILWSRQTRTWPFEAKS